MRYDLSFEFRGRNSFLGGVNVMHRAFANSEVRVLIENSELFQIFWRVVDCVPTYGTCPEEWRFNLGIKIQLFWTLMLR